MATTTYYMSYAICSVLFYIKYLFTLKSVTESGLSEFTNLRFGEDMRCLGIKSFRASLSIFYEGLFSSPQIYAQLMSIMSINVDKIRTSNIHWDRVQRENLNFTLLFKHPHWNSLGFYVQQHNPHRRHKGQGFQRTSCILPRKCQQYCKNALKSAKIFVYLNHRC